MGTGVKLGEVASGWWRVARKRKEEVGSKDKDKGLYTEDAEGTEGTEKRSGRLESLRLSEEALDTGRK